jgi:FkbH-like protein
MSFDAAATMPWLEAPQSDFRARCKLVASNETISFVDLQALCRMRLDLNQLSSLARIIRARKEHISGIDAASSFRLTVLGNYTTHYLSDALVGSAPRHGLVIDVIETPYDQMAQEVFNPESVLRRSKPDAVLIAIDHRQLGITENLVEADSARAVVARATELLRSLVEQIRSTMAVPCILQSLPQPNGGWTGSFDALYPGSVRGQVAAINQGIRDLCVETRSPLLDAEFLAASIGLARWHDANLWYSAKVAQSLDFVPHLAEHLAKVIAAMRGKSRKCLVLDLDNTLWGGVIGDDGMEGIDLANGSPLGEAFRAVQSYALACRQRGIVLAVCSKNEEANAREPFRSHPDMLLREEHIAVFVANWIDKASNLRTIAETLNIGLDALVFVDDNPAERARVRQMLPDVAVPELPEDPACYAETLAAASYFEALTISEDDRLRADFYRNNAVRSAEMRKLGSIDEYLASLEMECALSPFDEVGRARISQLINKSNQFNLTTRRYTEVQVAEIEHDPDAFHLQVRLVDKFGDNGMISVVIFKKAGLEWLCDTWLMSCRVLGRRVEEAILQTVVTQARERGAEALVGRYIPSAKNAMVAEHFGKLGFSLTKREPDGGSLWRLALAEYQDRSLPMRIIGVDSGRPTGREQRVALGS